MPEAVQKGVCTGRGDSAPELAAVSRAFLFVVAAGYIETRADMDGSVSQASSLERC